MDLDKNDYIVGMAITPKDEPKTNGGNGANGKKKKGAEEEVAAEVVAEATNARLILSVTENGYGKRTHVYGYRLQSRGRKGGINGKTTQPNGKASGITPGERNLE